MLTLCSAGPRQLVSAPAPRQQPSLPRRLVILPPPKATEITDPEKDEEAPSPSGSKVTSLDSMSKLAEKLLKNAASLRVVRAETYCVHCRGTGKETCPACQGAGIVQHEEAVRMNQVRHAAGKLKVMLGVSEPKMNESDWIRSNRCKRCRGTGALPCKYCNGSGRLGPAK